jgi:uncharacterized protein YecE (DUF72 family)
MSLLIGTSGWSYNEWVGPFYEKKTGMFSHYSKFFHTAEINSTFYRYPSEGMIMGLMRSAPPGFVFAVKLPKLITHDKWLNVDDGVVDDTHRFLALMRPLAERLGPILIQLRPKFNFDEHAGDLENYLDMIPKNYEWAVEFRHESWLRNETYDILRKHNVAYTVVDEPLLPPEVHITADFAYVRWHGHGAQLWYDYEYSVDQLEEWKPKVEEITGNVRRTYGYFNNHFNANAVKNAVEMLELLEQATPEQKIVHEKIASYREEFDRPHGFQPLEAFSSSDEDLSVADHLLHFTDIGRIGSGEKIKRSEVVISLSDKSHLVGDIRDYYIDIDLEQRVIKHNCDDWRKGMGNKRFCKHLVRFFMELPPGQAIRVLSLIWDEIDGWSFEE